MKKGIGWFLLVIVGLQVFGAIVKSSKGLEIGWSPAFVILLIMMFFGGISLISNANKKKDNE